MPATIFFDIRKLREYLDGSFSDMALYVTSGGFDPLHVGHLRCIQETSQASLWGRRETTGCCGGSS